MCISYARLHVWQRNGNMKLILSNIILTIKNSRSKDINGPMILVSIYIEQETYGIERSVFDQTLAIIMKYEAIEMIGVKPK